MKQFLSTLPRNLLDCFRGRMIIWHIIAIILTFLLVTSGFDWLYFASTRDPILRSWMFPAAPMGGLVPLALPLILLAIGSINRSADTTVAAWAVGQAELIDRKSTRLNSSHLGISYAVFCLKISSTLRQFPSQSRVLHCFLFIGVLSSSS